MTSRSPPTPPGIPIRSTLENSLTVQYSGLISQLNDKARSTVRDLQHYVKHTQQDDGNLHGWEINLLSPSKFVAYVAHRCVGTWIEG